MFFSRYFFHISQKKLFSDEPWNWQRPFFSRGPHPAGLHHEERCRDVLVQGLRSPQLLPPWPPASHRGQAHLGGLRMSVLQQEHDHQVQPAEAHQQSEFIPSLKIEKEADISSPLSRYRITKPRPIVRRPRSAVGSYRERSKNCRETQSFLPSTSQPHSTTQESRDRSIKGLGENWYSPAFPNRWAIKYPRRQNGEQIERLRWRFIIVTKTRDFVRNQVRVKMACFSLLAGITRSL